MSLASVSATVKAYLARLPVWVWPFLGGVLIGLFLRVTCGG